MSITDLKFDIDRDSKTPLWLQIRNELFNCLYRDELRPGQLIPNEKTLVELFNVSIGTIRKAVGMLEKEGFLIRKQGLGLSYFNMTTVVFFLSIFILHLMEVMRNKVLMLNLSLLSQRKQLSHKLLNWDFPLGVQCFKFTISLD